MSTLDTIAPTPGDRVFLCGQTGSGKTTLAWTLLEKRAYVVVVDAKGTLARAGYTLYRSVDEAINSGLTPDKAPKIIVRPPYGELRDPVAMDRLFRWIYLRGNCTLYVDETYGVTYGNTFVEHYGACLTRGRENGVEVWSGTQRPMDVPQIAISEAEHAYVFRLKMPQDRAKVSAVTGIEAEDIRHLPKQYFMYAPQSGEVRGPCRLKL